MAFLNSEAMKNGKVASAGPYAGKTRDEIFALKIKNGAKFNLGAQGNGANVIGVEYDAAKRILYYKRSASGKIESIAYSKVYKDRDFGGGKSSGSGGGAEETAINESLQCYYCSYVFNIKKGKVTGAISDDNLKKAALYAHTDKSLDYCLKNAPAAWVDDEVYTKIANALYAKYNAKVSGITHWHRGSSVMNGIYKLKANVHKKDKASKTPQAPGSFAHDKWNPGDIWMTKSASIIPFAESDDWASLNQQVYSAGGSPYGNSITTLAVSLKRIAASASPKIEPYNVPGMAKSTADFRNWKYGKNGDFFSSMDIYVTTAKGEVQFRTFNNTTSWQGQISGSAAAGGKIGGGNVDFYIKKNFGGNGIYGGYDSEDKLFTNANSSKKKQEEWAKKIYDLYVSLNKSEQFSKQIIPEKVWMKEWFDKSLGFRNSKMICVLFAAELMKGNNTQRNAFSTDLFRYGSSNADQSSYFIKVS